MTQAIESDIPRGLIPLPCGPMGNPSVKLGEKITFTTLLLVGGESCAVTYHGAEVVEIGSTGLVVDAPPTIAVTWERSDHV